MQEINYPLHWFDWAINDVLSPDQAVRSLFTATFCKTISSDAIREAEKQKQVLRHRSFELLGKNKSEYLSNYHRALILLYEQSIQNEAYYTGKSDQILLACEAVTSAVSSILNTAEINVHGSALQVRMVTSVSLMLTRQELVKRLDLFKARISGCLPDPLPVSIVVDNMTGSLEQKPGKIVTESDVLYQRTLITELSKMPISDQTSTNLDTLMRLLVYFNFNSPDFMSYYTNHILSQFDKDQGPNVLLSRMNFFRKVFYQMQIHPKFIFDRDHPGLRKVIGNWFEQEIQYIELEQQFHSDQSQNIQLPRLKPNPESYKVMCFLSVDQLAILLRSMDALRILRAKSLSMVMQSIAPFVSTPVKEDISHESLRTKSYSVEENDRRVAIKTLKSMITWIEEYKPI